MTRTEIPHSLVLFAAADPDLELRGAVSVCLSHVGLGFRPKLAEGGRAPSLNPPLLCSTCAPEQLVWSFFCCCVVPVSCFVTVLFDSCVAVQSCRGKSYMSIFFRFFLPYLQEHSCVEIQKFCYHGNMT